MSSAARQTEIPEAQAADHEVKLAALRDGLGVVGYQTLLTDYYGLTLRSGDYSPPTRAEPTLGVFWPDERGGFALTVRVLGDFYDWGTGRHYTGDVLGTVAAITDELKE
jgi:hypothetical protein